MCINELGESVGNFLQQKWRKHSEFEILRVNIFIASSNIWVHVNFTENRQYSDFKGGQQTAGA
jgi:hypothetical protein